jgi:hypothetical protein
MSPFEPSAYAVQRIEDLKPPVGAALQAQLLAGEAVRQIIFAPSTDAPPTRRDGEKELNAFPIWLRSPDSVLVLTEERLLIASIGETSDPPQVSATPLADLLWLELGTILLHSWFEWSWAGAGRQQQGVYFRTSRDEVFWEMANSMRRTIIAQAGRTQPTGKPPYGHFPGLPFKFKNLIPLTLMLPGEQVQAVVYQPTIWGHRLGVLRFQRAPATAVVLSPDYLLIAQDDLTNTRAAYGLIARYCPRGRLRKATLEQSQGNLWLNITVGVQKVEDTIRLLFEPGAAAAVEDLIATMSPTL